MNTDTADSISRTTVIDHELATLIYYPDSKIVHHIFHKPISGEPFREIVNTGVELLQKNGAIKWLSDDRTNTAFPDDDTEWGKVHWFPRALEAGWKYWALIVPPDVAARMNLKEFVDTFSQQGLRIMLFATTEDALEWLINVDAA